VRPCFQPEISSANPNASFLNVDARNQQENPPLAPPCQGGGST